MRHWPNGSLILQKQLRPEALNQASGARFAAVVTAAVVLLECFLLRCSHEPGVDRARDGVETNDGAVVIDAVDQRDADAVRVID